MAKYSLSSSQRLISRSIWLILFPTISQAQTEHAATSKTEDTIIVTASENPDNRQELIPAFLEGNIANGGRLGILGEQKALDVPFNVIGYTAKLIENQQAKTLSDVMINDASIQNVRGYGNFSQGFRIRGLDLYSDDISFSGVYGVLPRQIIPVEGIERIEVIKGANAFLNGVPTAGTGIGGNINIEPKRADLLPTTSFNLDYTGKDQFGVGLDIGRRFGETQQSGIRANVVHREGETAIHKEKQRLSAAILAMDYQGDDLKSSLDIGYIKSTIHHGRAGIRFSESLITIPAVPDNRTNYGQPWLYNDIETQYALLKGDITIISDWALYGVLGGSHTDESARSDSSIIENFAGSSSLSRLDTRYKANSFSGLLGIRGKFYTGEISHHVNIGYSGIYNHARSAYTLSLPTAGTNIYHPDDIDVPTDTAYQGGHLSSPSTRSRTKNSGFSLSDTLGIFNDRLLLTSGIRYQKMSIHNYDYDGIEDTGQRFEAHRWSPAFGLVWKIRNDLSFYANHTEGLQSGGTAPSTALNYGSIVGIATAKQNEIGLKIEKNRYGGSLALFDIRKPFGILGDDNIYRLAGEQRNQGIELAIFGEPILGWRINASSSWLKPIMTKTSDNTFHRKYAIGIPRYQWVINNEWDVPWVEDLTLSALLLHTGPQYANLSNTWRLPSWTRFDLGAQYVMQLHNSTLTWRLGLENVTNQKYWATIGSNNGFFTQSDPRTLKLSVSANF